MGARCLQHPAGSLLQPGQASAQAEPVATHSNQTYGEAARQQPRHLGFSLAEQSLPEASGWSLASRQGKGQQLQGSSKLLETGTQVWISLESCLQVTAFLFVEIPKGMACEQGIETGFLWI